MGDIVVSTPIPGPRSLELLTRRQQAVARGVSTTIPVFVEHGSGALVTDVDGNRFIDLAGGISSLNVGHTPPAIVEAIQTQASKYVHAVFHVNFYEPYVEFAEKLNRLVPGAFQKKTVLFNSGAEAVENAIKIAKRFTGRRAVVTFERGFHGRTLLGMSLTGKVKSFKTGFGPMASDVFKLSYPYSYRNFLTDRQLLEQFQNLFEFHVDPDDVAAVVLEPVQGDGGIIVPTPEFIQGVRKICNQHDILLIADEVQTGFGRTGKWFAMEHFGVSADLTAMSKSIGGGIPLAAVTGRADVMDAPEPKEVGSTLGGSPLGCVAGLKVIEMIEQLGLLDRATAIGERIRSAFDSSEHLGEVRGLGAMNGLEFVAGSRDRQPDVDFAKKVVEGCYKRGVLVLTAGAGNIVRLLPPLVIEDAQVLEALDVMRTVISELERGA
ncbi:aspartate aminotransferase family protein [Alicyclobacillus curvatus]|nr:aspartate aminotransferase family protein [Alicyclobacillus curvatus]